MRFEPGSIARSGHAGRGVGCWAVAGDSAGARVTAFENEREARVESPCIRHCTLDDDDICLGCFRSIDEICAWAAAGNAERRQILASALARRQQRVASGG